MTINIKLIDVSYRLKLLDVIYNHNVIEFQITSKPTVIKLQITIVIT